MLTSCPCTQKQLESPLFDRWKQILAPALPKRGLIDDSGKWRMHRKLWEWCYIAQALDERGFLQPGKKGLGFAVGKEPLPAAFAGFGCRIVATDLDTGEAKSRGWVATDQHGASLDAVNEDRVLDHEIFKQRVDFQFVDMNAIPASLRNGSFDFIWSSCSMEHLGSLRRGTDFVRTAMECLRPGGMAVHTTEFNCSSADRTIESGETVLYRRRDLAALAAELREQGHTLDLDFTLGELPADKIVDVPPYRAGTHLKLQLGEFVITSIGMIVTKSHRSPTYPRGPLGRAAQKVARLWRRPWEVATR
jgi:hypothetical protein